MVLHASASEFRSPTNASTQRQRWPHIKFNASRGPEPELEAPLILFCSQCNPSGHPRYCNVHNRPAPADAQCGLHRTH